MQTHLKNWNKSLADFVYTIINKITKKENISVHYDVKTIEDNKSYTDGDSIYLAHYDNLEYMLISFFHEYAHCRLRDKIPFAISNKHWNNTTTMQYEIQITMAGINFAKEQDIIFSDEAVKWILNQNFSYEEPEYI